MVIAQTSTTQSFAKTHRYAAVRQRSVSPKVIHSSLPETMPIATDPLAAAEVMAHQASKSDRVEKPCYHIALSVGAADQLSLLDWQEMATRFLDKAGLGTEEYQSVGYLHEDTEFPNSDETRPHIHLVVNRVGADSRAADTSWDYYRFQHALRDVEAEMGLSREPNSWDIDRRRDTPGQVHRLQNQPEAEPSIRTQLQDTLNQALENATSLEGITQFLQRSGIDVRVSDRGWSVAKDEVAFAGYQLGRRYTLPAIEKALTQQTRSDMAPEDDFFQSSPFDDGVEGGLVDGLSDQRDQANETATDNRFGMGYLLRASLGREAQRHHQTSSRMAGLSQDVMGYGQRLQYMSSDGIDGLNVAGMGLTAIGAGIGVAKYFADRLNEAKQQARSERVNGFIDRLDQIGDRTEALEGWFGQGRPGPEDEPNGPDSPSSGTGGSPIRPSGPDQGSGGGAIIPDPDGELAGNGNGQRIAGDRTVPEVIDGEILGADTGNAQTSGSRNGWGQAPDPVVDSTLIAGGRIDQLDMIAGVSPAKRKIQIDPNLPIDQQLDQVEQQITTLEDRLERLEEQAQEIETTQAAAMVPGEQVAARLTRYAEARAAAYLISPEEPITTHTLGTIQATSDRVTIDDPTYGTKFEAIWAEQEGSWQVETDELSAPERAKIADLPQTTEDYATQAQGKEVVRSLQQLAPTEFSRPEGGQVHWEAQLHSGDIQTYTFSIEPQANGTQFITGTNAQDESILAAQVSSDGVIKVSQSEIPAEQIDGLARKVGEMQTIQTQRTQRPPSRQPSQPNKELQL